MAEMHRNKAIATFLFKVSQRNNCFFVFFIIDANNLSLDLFIYYHFFFFVFATH